MVDFIGKIILKLKSTSNIEFSSLNNSLCSTQCNYSRPNSTTNNTVMSVLCPVCLLLRGVSFLIKTNQSAVYIASPQELLFSVVTGVFLFYLFIYLFIYGCVGSSFLCEGFL